MKKTKIKKNDQVLVISGKDRGSKGKVLRVFPARELAIVERVNMVKRHTRQNRAEGDPGWSPREGSADPSVEPHADRSQQRASRRA